MLQDSEIVALFYERSEQAITELTEKYGRACESIAKIFCKTPPTPRNA